MKSPFLICLNDWQCITEIVIFDLLAIMSESVTTFRLEPTLRKIFWSSSVSPRINLLRSIQKVIGDVLTAHFKVNHNPCFVFRSGLTSPLNLLGAEIVPVISENTESIDVELYKSAKLMTVKTYLVINSLSDFLERVPRILVCLFRTLIEGLTSVFYSNAFVRGSISSFFLFPDDSNRLSSWSFTISCVSI